MSRNHHRRTAALAAVCVSTTLPLAFLAAPARAVAAKAAASSAQRAGLQAYVYGPAADPAIAFDYDNGGSVGSGAAAPANVPGATDPVWEQDGRRLIYLADDGSIMSVDVYTGSKIALTTPPAGYADTPSTTAPTGRSLMFVRTDLSTGNGSLYTVATDGSQPPVPFFTTDGVNPADTGAPEASPTIANETLLFQRAGDIVTADGLEGGAPVYHVVVADAAQPTLSPDGKYVAFVKDVAGVPQLWTARSDGSDAIQVPVTANGAKMPSWSPDGKLICFGTSAGAKLVPVTEGASGLTFGAVRAAQGTNEDFGAWQPLAPGVGAVTRIAGGNAIETAIAASQHNYASIGSVGSSGRDGTGRIPAGAVVLSRSDEFYDALTGSAFAADRLAPLLLTPTASLDPQVQTEIARVLPKGGTVYLLGGDAALSPTVEIKLQALGYKVQRFAGSDMYATSVLVDQAIAADASPSGTPHAAAAIVATGTQYYDALAAGAAAGGFGEDTVIVLTDGTSMPAASAAYLNSLSSGGKPPLTYAVGGPGNTALHDALTSGQVTWGATAPVTALVGNDAEGTSVKVAQTFFGTDVTTAAIATTNGWYDALTGGAMSGVDIGPLLLTPPAGLDPQVADYLQQENGFLDSAEILGGTSALPDAVLYQVQGLVGLPDAISGPSGGPLPTGTAAKSATTTSGGSAPRA